MKKKTNTKKATKSVTFTHEQSSLELSTYVDDIAETINSLIVDLEDGTISPLDTVSVLLDIRYDVDRVFDYIPNNYTPNKKKVKK